MAKGNTVISCGVKLAGVDTCLFFLLTDRNKKLSYRKFLNPFSIAAEMRINTSSKEPSPSILITPCS